MLNFLQGRASGRKLRCFAFACGRRYCVIWEESAETDDYFRRLKPTVDELCGRIIDAAERLDDGEATAEIVEALRRQLWEGSGAPISLNWDITATVTGDADFWVRRYEDDCRSASEQASREAAELWKKYNERLFQADLIRDLVGPLAFRSVSLPSSVRTWSDGFVVKLATAIYEERSLPQGTLDSVRLGVLADALDEAGVTDPDIGGHLRQPGGVHVRGCFVIDMLLGKE
jgi:hypothetical protein